MKGDFYGYIAEFATGDSKGKAAQSARVAYIEANKIAEKDLVVNHPVRLAMARNSYVFHFEVLQKNDQDCEVLLHVSKQNPDFAGGVDVNKGDLDAVRPEYQVWVHDQSD